MLAAPLHSKRSFLCIVDALFPKRKGMPFHWDTQAILHPKLPVDFLNVVNNCCTWKDSTESSSHTSSSASCSSALFRGPVENVPARIVIRVFWICKWSVYTKLHFPGDCALFCSCLQSEVQLLLCWLTVDSQACLELFKWIFLFVIKLPSGRKAQSNIKDQLLPL